jgi:ArsR family transcriptional regulator, lead/cadmium/zinc/bismuth-responsive transcriptional repressor
MTTTKSAGKKVAGKRKSGERTERQIDDLVEIFKVLSDPTRIKIAITLSKAEMCVHDIAEAVHISESAASHQLRILRSLRLVKHRREGKQIFYSLDDHHIEKLIQVATEHIAERY